MEGVIEENRKILIKRYLLLAPHMSKDTKKMYSQKIATLYKECLFVNIAILPLHIPANNVPPKMFAAQKQEWKRSKTRRRTNVLIIVHDQHKTGHVMKVLFLRSDLTFSNPNFKCSFGKTKL